MRYLLPQISGLLQDLNNRMHLAADTAVYNQRKAVAEAAAAAAATAVKAENGSTLDVEMTDQHQQQQQQQQQEAGPSTVKAEDGGDAAAASRKGAAAKPAPSSSLAVTTTTRATTHTHTHTHASSTRGGGTEAAQEGAREALLARYAAHEGSAPLAILHSVLRDVSVCVVCLALCCARGVCAAGHHAQRAA